MSTPNIPNNRPLRILRRPEVCARTGLSVSGLYALMAQGKFPRPVRTGARSVGWDERLVEEHIRKVLQGDGWQSLGDAAQQVVGKLEGGHDAA